jgi:hypothetical protein
MNQPVPQVKNISASGQISLGKEFAGRTVSVEEREAGVWLVKLGEFVPDSERWLFAQGVQEELAVAESYAAANAPTVCDLEQLQQRLQSA